MDFVYNDSEGIEQTFSANCKKGTSALRIAFVELRQEFVDESARITKERQKEEEQFRAISGPTDEQLAKWKADSHAFSKNAIQMATRYLVGYLHLLLDQRNLETKYREMLMQPADSDFWQAQDLEEAGELINSFRVGNHLGE